MNTVETMTEAHRDIRAGQETVIGVRERLQGMDGVTSDTLQAIDNLIHAHVRAKILMGLDLERALNPVMTVSA